MSRGRRSITLRVAGSGIITGGHFTPGYYRPDAPTGTPIAEPAKPERQPEPEPVVVHHRRCVKPAAVANAKAHLDALAPRRWSPS